MSEYGNLRRAMRAASMVTELTFLLVAGLALGSWLDGWLHTEPWLFLIGTLAGMAAGFFRIFQGMKRLLGDDDPDDTAP